MTTPLWTWDALIAAAQGRADDMVSDLRSGTITGFSIDTRSIQRGEVFVALKDARDGHDFVTAAFKAGAAAALVRNDYTRKDGDGALIRVDDPLRALERIAIAARARLSAEARVIAVTGSAGKTGTKEMLRAVLSPIGKTHAPEKSFNNHWGVPLTLARMPADTKYAVIEIGMNHAGEITPLTKMARPHIAIITNVLPVHVGNFPDGEIGVANAKAEIFAGVEYGYAVLPRDSMHYERLAVACARCLPFTFGSHSDAMARAVEIAAFEASSNVDVELPDSYSFGLTADDPERVAQARHKLSQSSSKPRRLSYTLGAPGRHLAMNSLAVVAVLEILHLPLPTSLRPLSKTEAPAGRGARSTLALASGGSITLIDESYNANPASMRAALATLGTVPRNAHPRRIAVIGDMRELGEGSHGYHVGLAPDVLASGADLVFACGPYIKALFETLPAEKRGAWGQASTDIVTALTAAVKAGDVIMIKGSLGTNMAPLVAAVRSLDVAARSAKA